MERATEKAKKEYSDSVCEKIMELKKKQEDVMI